MKSSEFGQRVRPEAPKSADRITSIDERNLSIFMRLRKNDARMDQLLTDWEAAQKTEDQIGRDTLARCEQSIIEYYYSPDRKRT